jgi:hypothetical protein
METTKLLAGETNILSHGSTHRPAMDMGLAANERGRQITYSIRTLCFSKVILVTYGGRMCKNRPKFEVFQPRIHTQQCYGHGTGGTLKSTSNCVFYQEVEFS